MKEPLKVGDKIRFGGASIRDGKVWHEDRVNGIPARISRIMPGGYLEITRDVHSLTDRSEIHRRQVIRRLKPKKRREFWIEIVKGCMPYVHKELPYKGSPAAGSELIHVREVLKK